MKFSENNPLIKETYAYKMFGKRCKDLTKDEKRAYYTERQRQYRKSHPEHLERNRVYAREYARKHNLAKVPREESFVWVHFGKSYKELTAQEKYKYQKMMKDEVLGRD